MGTDSNKILNFRHSFSGLAETVDISLGGLSLSQGGPLFSGMNLTPAEVYRFVDKTIRLEIEDCNVVLWGRIVRVDPENMMICAVINKISDADAWRVVCDVNEQFC